MLKKQFIKNEVVAQHAWHRMLVISNASTEEATGGSIVNVAARERATTI